MKQNLWHTVMKRSATVLGAVMLAFSTVDSKADETQHAEKSPEIQMAEQIFDSETQEVFKFLSGGRDCIKNSVPAIKAFKHEQERAMRLGADVFDYDNQFFDARNKDVADAKFKEYYLARCLFKKDYTFQNRKFSTKSNFSPIEQISVYGNLNVEMTQAKDSISVYLVHGIATDAVRNELSFMDTEKDKDELYSGLLAYRLDRYYKLLDVCGNPGVYFPGLKLDVISMFAQSSGGIFSPNLLSSGGNIFLREISESTLIDEMAHAFRNRSNAIGEVGQFIGDGLKDLLTFNSWGFTPRAQSRNYRDKGKMEYDAHEVVAPVLKAYIEGEISTIPQVYSLIEKGRQEEGYSYAQTPRSKLMAVQGKLDTVSDAIKKTGLTDELQKLQQSLIKKKKNMERRMDLRNRVREHGGGGRH